MSFITSAIGNVVGSLTGANQQAAAAQQGSADQQAAAMAGIAQQNKEFQQVQGLESPFVSAGTNALTGYSGAQGQYASTLQQLGNLTGANGAGAQQTALTGLTSNPLYTTAMNLGQQSILQSASATGGLRGGNTVSSLGYLPQQVLSSVENQQIGNLGTTLQGDQGLMSSYGNLIGIGQNAASGTGNAGISTGNNITNLTSQAGQAQAGAAIAGGNATASGLNSLGSFLGSSAGQNALSAAGTAVSNGANYIASLF